MANSKAAGVVLENMNWHRRRKFFKDANQYIWDDPQLFKMGG